MIRRRRAAGHRGSIRSPPPASMVSATVPPEQPVLTLELPDPEQDDISAMDFQARLEEAWAVCDRFDLQTEIWRGRILRAVRDREKRGGEGRGLGFLQWLREHEISKTRAYTLIQLAESADNLLGEGLLDEGSVNQFSKRAFLETAQAGPEVQQLVSEAAMAGQQITRQQVRRLSDDVMAATSPLLPEEIRQRTADNLPPRPWPPWCESWRPCPMHSGNRSVRSCGRSPSWIGCGMSL